MPAYFSLILEFSRKNICPGLMQNFQEALASAGLAFQSGYWESEQDNLQSILNWNQKLLEQDFELGYDENVSHDYKQMLFRLDGFRHVRGFWMNRYPVREEFSFALVIPEAELFGDDVTTLKESYLPEKMQILRDLACQLWEVCPVMSIQTELELTGSCACYQDIVYGKERPSAHPFAILPRNAAKTKDFMQFQKTSLHRGGMLLELSGNL